jgi:hypothetical protein
MELLKEGVLLLLSLRLLHGLLYRISAGVPSLHVPRSSLLAAAINGALLDGTKNPTLVPLLLLFYKACSI